MPKFVYVDNSNIWIEGQRVSAVDLGMAPNIFDAMNNRTLDYSYRLDFGKLHSFVANGEPGTLKRAMLFGSRPPPNDKLWELARFHSWDVHVEDRNIQNKEKGIDTGIVAAMTRDAYTLVDRDNDILVLVAGDRDYTPPVRMLLEDGFAVDVVFWDHGSRELRELCSMFGNKSHYISLNPHLRSLSYA